MRRKDFFLVFFITLGIGYLAHLFKLDYRRIASDSLTVISITLGIYMASIGGLIGSHLSTEMKSIPDNQQPFRSQLGRLVNYFTWAILDSIMTLILTSVFLLLPVTERKRQF